MKYEHSFKSLAEMMHELIMTWPILETNDQELDVIMLACISLFWRLI